MKVNVKNKEIYTGKAAAVNTPVPLTKMVKKIFIIGVILTMGVGLFAGCGKEDYVYKEGDFSLEISVDKTEVSVGDTIYLVAVLRNLSGKDIRIENFSDKIDGIMSIYIFNDPTSTTDVPGGPKQKRKRFLLSKDASISTARDFIVDGELMEIEAFLGVSFYIGKSNENTYIKSKTIKILVKE